MKYLEIKCFDKYFDIFLDEEYIGFLYRRDFMGFAGGKYDKAIKAMMRGDVLSMDDITDEDAQYLRDLIIDKAFNKATYYASVVECSPKTISTKLSNKRFPEYAIDAAIEMMYSYNYLNDGRFVESFVRSYIRTKSRRLIETEISMKGISPEDYSEIIDQVYEDEGLSVDEIIANLVHKKFGNVDLRDEKVKKKVISFLLRHGFSFENINDFF